jgi:hypothetical protein
VGGRPSRPVPFGFGFIFRARSRRVVVPKPASLRPITTNHVSAPTPTRGRPEGAGLAGSCSALPIHSNLFLHPSTTGRASWLAGWLAGGGRAVVTFCDGGLLRRGGCGAQLTNGQTLLQRAAFSISSFLWMLHEGRRRALSALGSPASRWPLPMCANYPNPTLPAGGRQDHAHHASQGITNLSCKRCLRFPFASAELHARTVFRLT